MKMKILAISCLMLQFNTYAGEDEDLQARQQAALQMKREALQARSTVQSANADKDACLQKFPGNKNGECNGYIQTASDAQKRVNDLENKAGLAELDNQERAQTNEAKKKSGDKTCSAMAKDLKGKLKERFASNNEMTDATNGSSAMASCLKLTNGAMRHVARDRSNWELILNGTDECIAASDACTTADNPQEKMEKKSKCEAVKVELAKCDAAAFIIDSFERSWEKQEHTVTKDFKGGNPPITCQGKGVATIDYDACVKFVSNGDIMDVAQGAIQKGQELYYADKTMTAQADAAKSDNTATAALQALKSSVTSQKEIMEQRAALDSGKLAVLANYYMDMPTNDDIKTRCNKYSFPTSITAGEMSPKALCDQVANENKFGFLMNQMAKEKMKAKLVKVGIDVGSDAVMAGLMAKRAGDINNAIANVESFKPIDPIAPQANNLQTTYCQQNPGDAKCLTGGLDRTFDAMNDNVVTFGEGGTGTSYANTNPFTGDGTTSTNAVSPTDRKSVTGVGSAIAAAQQGSGLANPIAAGAITKGGGPTGGGGGGGSAGGGGGGGGGGVPSSQGQGGVSSAIAGRAPAYNGGSGFSILNGGGGLRGGGKAKDKEENPFGKLFGKNANANGAVNFREIASKVGGKSDNIFDMISNRYSKVNTEKRLLEYEIAK